MKVVFNNEIEFELENFSTTDSVNQNRTFYNLDFKFNLDLFYTLKEYVGKNLNSMQIFQESSDETPIFYLEETLLVLNLRTFITEKTAQLILEIYETVD